MDMEEALRSGKGTAYAMWITAIPWEYTNTAAPTIAAILSVMGMITTGYAMYKAAH